MGLFDSEPNKVSPAQLQQLKAWVYETLSIDTTIPISISQLKCSEPGCSPLETVIAVMSQPSQTYKIHSPAVEIGRSDVVEAIDLQTRKLDA